MTTGARKWEGPLANCSSWARMAVEAMTEMVLQTWAWHRRKWRNSTTHKKEWDQFVRQAMNKNLFPTRLAGFPQIQDRGLWIVAWCREGLGKGGMPCWKEAADCKPVPQRMVSRCKAETCTPSTARIKQSNSSKPGRQQGSFTWTKTSLTMLTAGGEILTHWLEHSSARSTFQTALVPGTFWGFTGGSHPPSHANSGMLVQTQGSFCKSPRRQRRHVVHPPRRQIDIVQQDLGFSATPTSVKLESRFQPQKPLQQTPAKIVSFFQQNSTTQNTPNLAKTTLPPPPQKKKTIVFNL